MCAVPEAYLERGEEMGVPHRARGARSFRLPALVFYGAMLVPVPGMGGESLPIFAERIPSTPLSCLLMGRESRLSDIQGGRPMVIYFSDVRAGAPASLERFLAEQQAGYAPWFTWVSVLDGRGEAEEIERVLNDSLLRSDQCFHDRDGQWRKALGIEKTPALFFFNEDGYLVRRQEGFQPGDGPGLERTFDRLARAYTLGGGMARDFKLPEIGAGRLLTLLEVARKDYTMLLFLQANCISCLSELRLLELIRNRYRDRVGLVAVFHDPAQDERVRRILDAYQLHPDYILADPGLLQPGGYHFRLVPVLLVIGPDGKIIFSRKGFQSREASPLAAQLDRLFWMRPAADSRSPFQEARRIHDEALQFLSEGKVGMAALYLERILELHPDFYTLHCRVADAYLALGRRKEAARGYARYLAAESQPYDLVQVREKIRSLAE